MRSSCAIIATFLPVLAVSSLPALGLPMWSWPGSSSHNPYETGTSNEYVDPLSEVVAGYQPAHQKVASQYNPARFGAFDAQGHPLPFSSPQVQHPSPQPGFSAPYRYFPEDRSASMYPNPATNEGFPQQHHDAPGHSSWYGQGSDAHPPDLAHRAQGYAHMYDPQAEEHLTWAELRSLMSGNPYGGVASPQNHMMAPLSTVQMQPGDQLAATPDAISRGKVLADEKFMPRKFTPLQHVVSKFRLPSAWQYLTTVSEAQIKFTGFHPGHGYNLRMAKHPNLAKLMSLELLSNQQLVIKRQKWEKMGLRFIFAQDKKVAFGVVEAQMLKSAFPGMLEADKQKLQDGSIAIIRAEKEGKQVTYKLFSVLNPEFVSNWNKKILEVAQRVPH